MKCLVTDLTPPFTNNVELLSQLLFFFPECSLHKGCLVISVSGSDACQLQKMYTEANRGQILLVNSTVGHLVS